MKTFQTNYILTGRSKRTGHGFFREISKNKTLYAMFIPVAVFFILFAYLPMAGIIIAFKDYNYAGGILHSPWIGFKNFEYFFNSGKAFLVTKNTILFNIIFISCYTFFSVLVAIFISEMRGKLFKKTAQSFMLLPYFVSWVIVSAFLYSFINYDFGLVNTFLKSIGHEPVSFYNTPQYWYFLLPFLYVWKWVGFGSLLYLAAITGIDQECYESAYIDGANVFQKIYHITLPLLKPTMFILVLLALGRILRGDFDMFYNLIGNNSMLLESTDVVDTLVFRSLVGIPDFGLASSAGFYQSVICFIIIMTVNKLVKMYNEDYALF